MSAPRAPSPGDPVAGRSLEMWEQSFRFRANRLQRLLDFTERPVPAVIVSGEIKLIRQALDAIEELRGLSSLSPETGTPAAVTAGAPTPSSPTPENAHDV